MCEMLDVPKFCSYSTGFQSELIPRSFRVTAFGAQSKTVGLFSDLLVLQFSFPCGSRSLFQFYMPAQVPGEDLKRCAFNTLKRKVKITTRGTA